MGNSKYKYINGKWIDTESHQSIKNGNRIKNSNGDYIQLNSNDTVTKVYDAKTGNYDPKVISTKEVEFMKQGLLKDPTSGKWIEDVTNKNSDDWVDQNYDRLYKEIKKDYQDYFAGKSNTYTESLIKNGYYNRNTLRKINESDFVNLVYRYGKDQYKENAKALSNISRYKDKKQILLKKASEANRQNLVSQDTYNTLVKPAMELYESEKAKLQRLQSEERFDNPYLQVHTTGEILNIVEQLYQIDKKRDQESKAKFIKEHPDEAKKAYYDWINNWNKEHPNDKITKKDNITFDQWSKWYTYGTFEDKDTYLSRVSKARTNYLMSDDLTENIVGAPLLMAVTMGHKGYDKLFGDGDKTDQEVWKESRVLTPVSFIRDLKDWNNNKISGGLFWGKLGLGALNTVEGLSYFTLPISGISFIEGGGLNAASRQAMLLSAKDFTSKFSADQIKKSILNFTLNTVKQTTTAAWNATKAGAIDAYNATKSYFHETPVGTMLRQTFYETPIEGMKYTFYHPIESFAMPRATDYFVNRGFDAYENLTGNKLSDGKRRFYSSAAIFGLNPTIASWGRGKLGLGPDFIDGTSNAAKQYLFKAMHNGDQGATYTSSLAANILKNTPTAIVGTTLSYGYDKLKEQSPLLQNPFVDTYLQGLLYGSVLKGTNKLVSFNVNHFNQLTSGSNESAQAIRNAIGNAGLMLSTDMTVHNGEGLSYQQYYELTPAQEATKLHLKNMDSYNVKSGSETPELYSEAWSGKSLEVGQTIGAAKVTAQFVQGKHVKSDDLLTNASSQFSNLEGKFGDGAVVFVAKLSGSEKLPSVSQMEKEGWTTVDGDGNVIKVTKDIKFVDIESGRKEASTVERTAGRQGRNDIITDLTNAKGNKVVFNANGNRKIYLRDGKGQIYEVTFDVSGAGSAAGGVTAGISDAGQIPIVHTYVKKINNIDDVFVRKKTVRPEAKISWVEKYLPHYVEHAEGTEGNPDVRFEKIYDKNGRVVTYKSGKRQGQAKYEYKTDGSRKVDISTLAKGIVLTIRRALGLSTEGTTVRYESPMLFSKSGRERNESINKEWKENTPQGKEEEKRQQKASKSERDKLVEELKYLIAVLTAGSDSELSRNRNLTQAQDELKALQRYREILSDPKDIARVDKNIQELTDIIAEWKSGTKYAEQIDAAEERGENYANWKTKSESRKEMKVSNKAEFNGFKSKENYYNKKDGTLNAAGRKIIERIESVYKNKKIPGKTKDNPLEDVFDTYPDWLQEELLARGFEVFKHGGRLLIARNIIFNIKLNSFIGNGPMSNYLKEQNLL